MDRSSIRRAIDTLDAIDHYESTTTLITPEFAETWRKVILRAVRTEAEGALAVLTPKTSLISRIGGAVKAIPLPSGKAVLNLVLCGALLIGGVMVERHRPKPGPVNPPTPVIPVTPPAPIADDGVYVLVVYESGDLQKLPPKQAALLTSQLFRDELDAVCTMGSDGKTKNWRMWDQNVDLTNVSPVWQKVMSRPRASVPWIVISNGKTGYEGVLPSNLEDALALVKKWGAK